MKHGCNLSLDLFGDRLRIDQGAEDDGGEHKKMLKTMRNAVAGELTERQRECLRLRYVDKLPVKGIAAMLDITPSTVSRHLKKARGRIRTVMRYYYTRL